MALKRSVHLNLVAAKCFRTQLLTPFSRVADGDRMLYTKTHAELQLPVKRFIENEINPHVDKWEAECMFPAKHLFRSLGRLGVFGVDKPIEFGGLGLDFSYNIAVAETMGEVSCGAIPMACAVQSDMATPALLKHGTDKLKREFLEPTVLGERVACLGVSEQCAGSDVAGIQTTASIGNGDFVINGSKCWITNGHQADWICLLTKTRDIEIQGNDPHKQMTLFCVDMRSPGIKLGRRILKLGMHCSDTAEIFFDNVRVPAYNVIGRPGLGFQYQMEQFQNERLVGVAMLLRPLQRVLDATVAYAMERQIFGGKAFDRHQTIRYTLAELSTELQALSSLLYSAVVAKIRTENNPNDSKLQNSRHVDVLASMAKFKAGRLARRLTDECLQIWGANGYTWESAMSRAFRDFRLYSIGGGCDEVMLSMIAKHIKNRIGDIQ